MPRIVYRSKLANLLQNAIADIADLHETTITHVEYTFAECLQVTPKTIQNWKSTGRNSFSDPLFFALLWLIISQGCKDLEWVRQWIQTAEYDSEVFPLQQEWVCQKILNAQRSSKSLVATPETIQQVIADLFAQATYKSSDNPPYAETKTEFTLTVVLVGSDISWDNFLHNVFRYLERIFLRRDYLKFRGRLILACLLIIAIIVIYDQRIAKPVSHQLNSKNSDQIIANASPSVIYLGIEEPPFFYPPNTLPHKFRFSDGKGYHLSPQELELIYWHSFNLPKISVGGNGMPNFWMFLPDPSLDTRPFVLKLYETKISLQIPVMQNGVHTGEFTVIDNIQLETQSDD